MNPKIKKFFILGLVAATSATFTAFTLFYFSQEPQTPIAAPPVVSATSTAHVNIFSRDNGGASSSPVVTAPKKSVIQQPMPSGFRGPTGPPHINGPTSPPPNY